MSKNPPTWKQGKTALSVLSTLSDNIRHCFKKRYSFIRPLTPVEWDVLQSYTRRIRYMLDDSRFLDWESVGTFLNPAIDTRSLFPNLRHLDSDSYYQSENEHLINMPFPSLITLNLGHEGEFNLLQGSLESFSKFSPNIRKLYIHLVRCDITSNDVFSGCICRWKNLQTVECPEIPLDVNALIHLSRMPTLTRLIFTLDATVPDQITPSHSPIFFSHLHELELYSESLDWVSRLLSQTRLPAVIAFKAFIESRPSKSEARSFLTSTQTSFIGHTIQELHLEQDFPEDGTSLADDSRPVLGFEGLQPFMAFGTFRRLDLDIDWNVDLTSSELLVLASAWPELRGLRINNAWGWNIYAGITPSGLLQLLQTCRSLSDIALAMDTRGYTQCCQSPASLGLVFPRLFVNIVDSAIELESLLAISTFLANLILYSEYFSFIAGDHRGQNGMRESVHKDLWYDAWKQSNQTVARIYDSFGYPSKSGDVSRLWEVKSLIRNAQISVN